MTKLPNLKGIKIQAIDTPTQNGRIYPRRLIEPMCGIAPVYGKLRQAFADPVSIFLDPRNASHQVVNRRIEDNYLVGDVEILKTPTGQILRELFTIYDADILFTIHATATFRTGLDRGCLVVESCTLLTIDAINKGT